MQKPARSNAKPRHLTIVAHQEPAGRAVDGQPVAATPAEKASERAARDYFVAVRPWHEAAHQVVGTALGYAAALLTLDPLEARSGDPAYSRFEAASSVACQDAPPVHRAWIAAAGIAQAAYFGAPGLRPSGPAALACCIANANAEGGDWPSLLRFVSGEVDALAAIAAARELLAKLQPYVLRLGAVLAERRRLEGQEIAEIINAETARLAALPGAVALDVAIAARVEQVQQDQQGQQVQR